MRFLYSIATLGCAVWVGMCAAPAAANTTYDFSIDLSHGDVTGVLTGTLVLDFVDQGGSGSGAASSVTLTSVPAGFGSLADGNIVTDWSAQVQNQFTVSQGEITGYEFFAATGPCDGAALALGSDAAYGCYQNFPALNEFESNNATYGYNEGGSAGISFTELQSVPEPSGLPIFTIALIATAGILLRGRRKEAADGLAYKVQRPI